MSRESKQAARAVWGASPAGATHATGADPGTREFFERVLERRSGYELPWLDEVVRFDMLAGRRVLEVGCGAGYDAYAFCRHGCDYTGVDITPQNLDRTRRHLALYGLAAPLTVADAERLPFDTASFDFVYSMGVLHHVPDTQRSFDEIARVLRPGGEFCVGLYHRDSIFYWLSLWLHDHLLRGGFRRMSFEERLARIEYTDSGALPLVKVYSRGELARMLSRAGLEMRARCVRKLVLEDLPAMRFAGIVYRRLPQRVLDLAGRAFGWYVLARAVKPRQKPLSR